MKSLLSRWLCAVVASTVLGSALVAPVARAGMISTQEIVERTQGKQQRAEIKAWLARDDVASQLVAWGVDPADAQARVDSLSPAELEEMAQKMDQLPAGGDVIAAVVFVFLVLLVTDILGFTDIFPFVKKPNQR